jgi:hypothetical protein
MTVAASVAPASSTHRRTHHRRRPGLGHHDPEDDRHDDGPAFDRRSPIGQADRSEGAVPWSIAVHRLSRINPRRGRPCGRFRSS